jgi:hypothetical protein
MSGVFAHLTNSFDQRVLTNVTLRPLEGIAIDVRPLSTPQILKMVEEICAELAKIRGARLLGK